MIILDSDVLSEAMRANDVVASWLNRQPRSSIWTTAITIFEIRSGLRFMPSGRRRTERETAFTRLIVDKLENRILAFDELAAEQAAILMEKRRSVGRPVESRDTMIAGIALAQRATLATRNIRHFGDLTIPVVDPWQQ
jgi:predicted nucleic acid-binding protein